MAADLIGKDRKRFSELLERLGIDREVTGSEGLPKLPSQPPRREQSSPDPPGGVVRVAVLDNDRRHGELNAWRVETGVGAVGLECECRWYCSLAALEAKLDAFLPHIVVAHLNATPHGGGATACAQLRERAPEVRCLLCTSSFENPGTAVANAVGLGDWVVANRELDEVMSRLGPLFFVGAEADRAAKRAMPPLCSRRTPYWRPATTLSDTEIEFDRVWKDLALQVTSGRERAAARVIRTGWTSFRKMA